MSTELDAAPTESVGPELSPLGKRIEMLRIERGISKQHLARFAGTSRQQLWRVMTGKSDLTGALGDRLAEALQVDRQSLTVLPTRLLPLAIQAGADPAPPDGQQDGGQSSIEQYLANADAIAATLAGMPGGEAGRRLKRAHLDALEDEAHARRLLLADHVFELRRRVLNAEL